MKPTYTLPVLALFTACASSPALTETAEDPPRVAIPTVVKERAAKYAGITLHSVEYTLTNSRTGASDYKEPVNLARFIREDATTFSLSCSELGNKISLSIIASQWPHATFKEASQLLEQKRQYEIGEIMLRCPKFEA